MTAAGPVAHPAWRVTRRVSSRTLGDMGRRSGRLVRCNGTNVDGSRCGNEFRTESWRTKCHVHRFSGERGWLARKLEERRGSAGPGAVSSMPDPSDGSIADDDWRRETRRRARQLVGGRRWNEFEARATVQNCRQLADVADALSRVRAGGTSVDHRRHRSHPACRSSTRPRPGCGLRAGVCGRAAGRHSGAGDRTADHGCAELCGARHRSCRCPCWLATTRHEGKDATRSLRRSLPELATE